MHESGIESWWRSARRGQEMRRVSEVRGSCLSLVLVGASREGGDGGRRRKSGKWAGGFPVIRSHGPQTPLTCSPCRRVALPHARCPHRLAPWHSLFPQPLGTSTRQPRTTTTTATMAAFIDKLEAVLPPGLAKLDAFPKLPGTYKARSESRGFLTLFVAFL